jgi:hypothetical protein
MSSALLRAIKPVGTSGGSAAGTDVDGLGSGVEIAIGSEAVSVACGSGVASEELSMIAVVDASSALAAGATSTPKTNVKNVNKLATFFIRTPRVNGFTDAVLSQ